MLHIHTVVTYYRLLCGLQTVRPVMMRLHCCKTLNIAQDYAATLPLSEDCHISSHITAGSPNSTGIYLRHYVQNCNGTISPLMKLELVEVTHIVL